MGFTPRIVRTEDVPGVEGTLARVAYLRKVAVDEIAKRTAEAELLGVEMSAFDTFCCGLRALLDDEKARDLLRLELDS